MPIGSATGPAAPARDALVADLLPEERRGEAYGLRPSMDTVGAFAGPLLAIGLMWLWQGDIRRVFWAAALSALVAVAILWVFVREPARPAAQAPTPPRFGRAELRALRPAFLRVTLFGAVLALARISDAFLILKAADAGLAALWAPAVFGVLKLVHGATAWPVGLVSDRIGASGLLRLSILTLAGAHSLFAFGGGLPAVFLGVALWGLHMGLSQGLLAALVARSAPPEMRGTAFGLFNLAGGLATLVANAAAGALWYQAGPAATFAVAGSGALLALLLAPR
ncbi:MFS transporter [Frigidibacter sp. SD6-1]|uniref:MFS transporter n=1 Tax=Frigidibacter sp. SD6-1 TaxID=3032581 RepID=UPI0024DF3CB0|nr:MFS transporter [Frigidibacter sp. SD6-1]